MVTACIQNRRSFFIGPRSYYLWQPTIIGSQCQLVHSDWLPLVLQTEDRQRWTDNFVYIISAVVFHDHGVLGPTLLGTHVLQANYWSDAQKEIYGLFQLPASLRCSEI